MRSSVLVHRRISCSDHLPTCQGDHLPCSVFKPPSERGWATSGGHSGCNCWGVGLDHPSPLRQELLNSQQQEEELPELSASTVVQTGGQGVEESRPVVVHVLVRGRKRGSGVHLRSPRTKRVKKMPARFIVKLTLISFFLSIYLT